MAESNPSFVQPGYATSNMTRTLINDLNSVNPAVFPKMLEKYGNQNYIFMMNLLGRTSTNVKVDNKQFHHFEKRSRFLSVAAAAQVTGGAAGAAVTVTVAAADHLSSGTQSPVRVKEVVVIASTGVQCEITAVSRTTPSAHTFTIKPLNSADEIKSAGSANLSLGELFLFRGPVNVGAASTAIDGIAPGYDKITNTTTEHREDFPITDVADQERQIINLGDSPYYYDYALDEMNKRYLNQQFFKLIEGTPVDNIAGTSGTTGVIPRVAANGINMEYSSMAIADIQRLVRSINFFGSPGEYHVLADMYAKQAFSNLLHTTYKDATGGVTWESVGGSKESAAAYGFDTLSIDGITFHLFNTAMFNTEAVYKRIPTLAKDHRRDFMLCIPQGLNQDDVTGELIPNMQIVYQSLRSTGNKIETFETGGASNGSKTNTMERRVVMVSYPGMRVFGANQYAIFKKA